MSILRTLIDEMAANGTTSAHSIATNPGSLFAGGHVDLKKEKDKAKKIFRRVMQYIPTTVNEDISSEMGSTNFDPSDVLSKLDAAQKRMKTEDDTTAFGLEDETGNVVKVYVRNDQAEDFEKALGDALSGADEDEDEMNSGPEIAEVLYNLKDRFDIVDAKWPEIETDEEQEQEVGEEGGPGGEEGGPGGEEGMGGEGGAEGEGGEEGMEGEGGEDEMGMGDEMGGEEAATSALQSVIDVMKSDAEAKKAEAEARTAEARAKEAEYAAQSASHKVKQEEQVLDMESYNNQKKEQEDESKRLASLAKYQHDKASDMEGQLSGGYDVSMESAEIYSYPDTPPEEEDDDLTLQELSDYILRFLSGQR